MSLTIFEQVPLSKHTTLKVGGPARYFIAASSVEDIEAAVLFAEQAKLPLLVLGGGSNMLCSDEGYNGVVLQIACMGVTYSEKVDGRVTLTAGAGQDFDAVIEDSVSRGYYGLENLSAIPGTVGATPVQNVGAYGVEVKDVIDTVTAFHIPTSALRTFTNAECMFGYRDSFFKTYEGLTYIITAVQFVLQKNAQPNIQYADLKKIFSETEKNIAPKIIRDAIIDIRSKKFPNWRVVGTAGSFFKNPIIKKTDALTLQEKFPELPLYPHGEDTMKVSLGYILDKVCNLKGFRVGQVGLYESQALVLINHGNATQTEISAFADEVATRVKDATGISIEREVRSVVVNET